MNILQSASSWFMDFASAGRAAQDELPQADWKRAERDK